MVTSPLDLFQQVSQVRSYWDVVLPCVELIVKVLVIGRILLKDHTVPCQQVGQSIRCHSAVNVYLVPVLVVEMQF